MGGMTEAEFHLLIGFGLCTYVFIVTAILYRAFSVYGWSFEYYFHRVMVPCITLTGLAVYLYCQSH